MIRKLDAALNYQWDFQDPASFVMEGVIDLHHDLMFLIFIIIVFILTFLSVIIFYIKNINYSYKNFIINIYKKTNKKIKIHHIFIEIFWTITPAYILTLIIVPSLALLYSMDEIIEAELTVKVVGNQWFWTYEYTDFIFYVINYTRFGIVFHSYYTMIEELTYGTLRLLEVDNRVNVPIHTAVRFLITSNDVLHSWAIPSLGIKLDACPGRLNQLLSIAKRFGTLYGQCSEICGINHAFMPISLDILSIPTFFEFVRKSIY